MLWRYFAWCNQTLAVFTIWTLSVYLVSVGKNYWITFIPALFMTAVCTTYLFVAPECFGCSMAISLPIGLGVTLLTGLLFIGWKMRYRTLQAD